MKNLLKIFTVFLILVSTSCTQDELIDSPIESKKANTSTVDVTLDDGGDLVGSATLLRNKNGVTVNIKTSELLPGGAYTVWFIIFDAPDVFVDALYATGHVIGNNGDGNFSAHLSEGDVSGSIATGVGLTDAEHQGVHMVIRSHGPAIPGVIDDQIHTVAGGCNPCTDEQSAIFFPIP
jgi:hypothetical protein